MFTFTPHDTARLTVSGTFDDVVEYVRHTYPGVIFHGTSVNDGVVEYGKFVEIDARSAFSWIATER